MNFSFNVAPTITIDQIFAKMIPENVGTLFREKPNLIHSTIWKFYWVSVKQLLLPIYIICEANKFFPVQHNKIDCFPTEALLHFDKWKYSIMAIIWVNRDVMINHYVKYQYKISQVGAENYTYIGKVQLIEIWSVSLRH